MKLREWLGHYDCNSGAYVREMLDLDIGEDLVTVATLKQAVENCSAVNRRLVVQVTQLKEANARLERDRADLLDQVDRFQKMPSHDLAELKKHLRALCGEDS